MRRLLANALGAWFVLGAAPAVSAEPADTGEVYAGLMLGSTLSIQSWDLQRTSDGADTPEAFSPQFGLRAGWSPLSWGSVEGEWSYLPTGSTGGGGLNHSMSWRAGALVHPIRFGRFEPFATLGSGLYHNVAGSRGVDADMRFDWGLGVRASWMDDLAVRAEVRHVVTDGVGEFTLANNLEPLLALDYAFGAPAEREVAPPSDLDGDGVVDAKDACPDVSGSAATQGCPDTDSDAIADAEDACHDVAGIAAMGGCPDTDGDQLTDAEDRCPSEAGDAKMQGCPDADADGVADLDDACPSEAEDEDGFKDEDGCPEPDNDEDGIADADDRCPLEPELVNGFEDTDGCPEPDADADGIVDAQDKCPNEAETYNGNKDEDGCPDGKETVVVTAKEVKILEKIYFETGKAKIRKRSLPLLDIVAKVLEQNPQLTGLRVEGHTDDVGDAAENEALSQRRAEAVREYLISKGVDGQRLGAKGFGESQPLCLEMEALLENKRRNRRKIKKCRAENRRVQFQVVTINNKPAEPSEPETPAPSEAEPKESP